MKLVSLLLAAGVCFAQSTGTETKPKPDEYPVQAQIKIAGQPVTLGAEFMVHSFSRGEEMYIAPDFLVVEVALYPPKGNKIRVSPTQFSLRVNGKPPIGPQPPGAVAASLSHPERRGGPHFSGGLPGVGIGLPRRPTGAPGPQDPGAGAPNPMPQDNPDLQSKEHVSAEELAVQTALPQGDFSGPVSGFVYFAFKGKTSSIKTLELLFEDTAVKLR